MNYYRNDIESNNCDFSMPFCSPIWYFAAMNLLPPAPQSKRICKVSTHKTWRFSQTHSENGKNTFFSVSSSRPPYKPEEIDVRLQNNSLKIQQSTLLKQQISYVNSQSNSFQSHSWN